MMQIKKLTLTHKKDLRVILEDFQLVLNDGDKAVIIGEEGNGKSTLLKWMYDPALTEDYIESTGERIVGKEQLGYLPQELPEAEKLRKKAERIYEEKEKYEKQEQQVSEEDIADVWILEPKVFEDARGYFMETWREEDFNRGVGKEVHFVQDNQSMSSKGVLRGLHYQKGEASQAKLVRVLQGTVVDVAVDLRKDSPTFGKHVMVELSAENKRQLFIPRGFAHGFQVLSETAVFTYKVDNRYAPEAECSIHYNDEDLALEWPLSGDDVILSEKDLKHAVSFKEAEKF